MVTNLNVPQVFIGVDGGATKCHIRVEDESGQVLAETLGGPASIKISALLAWASINEALNKILKPLKLHPTTQIHVGMGLAGCEIEQAYRDFIQIVHPFTTLIVRSDAYIACLAAHNGRDGQIIIAGTGVVGLQVLQGNLKQVGGWGFPHDDEGGGAWLGLKATRLTSKWLDGRAESSGLAQAIFNNFAADPMQLVSWANQANATAFAELAPIVIQQSQSGDKAAQNLLKDAAHYLSQIAVALNEGNQVHLPCALVGGVAPYIIPYLTKSLQSRLVKVGSPPVVGAIYLVKQFLNQAKPT